jgi:uncharacterized protein (TIGR02265 family)
MFAEPAWSQPIDFAARLAAVPAHAAVRGMFLQLLIDSSARTVSVKLPAKRYIGFKNYPMREYVELLAQAAAGNRALTAAECVRRLGRGVYPTYEQTITGTAIFGIAGRNFARVIEASPTAYKVSLQPSIVRVRSLGSHHAEVELRQTYNLPDFHQVGIWEGAMQVCGVTGHIKTHVIDYGAVDFEIDWT